MHAGEHGYPTNVRDAIIMGATRIGHGILVDKDTATLEYMRRNKIPMVNSLKSNFDLETIDQDYRRHPFLFFLRLGLPISLSTDDEGMFHTDISNECVIAVTTSNIQYTELKALSYNAIDTSFASEDLKAQLRGELDREFSDLEASFHKKLKDWDIVGIALACFAVILAIVLIIHDCYFHPAALEGHHEDGEVHGQNV